MHTTFSLTTRRTRTVTALGAALLSVALLQSVTLLAQPGDAQQQARTTAAPVLIASAR